MKIFTTNFIYLSLMVFSSIQASTPSPSTLTSSTITNQTLESIPVRDILFAKPFTLEQGYNYDWSQERPIVKEGVIVVLKVDPELVVPRDAQQPILFADQQIVQRLNHGNESGHSIAIIPGRVDLSTVKLWFASPSLVAQISTNKIDYKTALAKNDAIKAFNQQKLSSVTQQNTSVSNLYVLLRDVVAELVMQYSPEDNHLARDWQLPIASR